MRTVRDTKGNTVKVRRASKKTRAILDRVSIDFAVALKALASK